MFNQRIHIGMYCGMYAVHMYVLLCMSKYLPVLNCGTNTDIPILCNSVLQTSFRTIHNFDIPTIMVFPSDHPLGWKSKLKLNVSVWTVIIALTWFERQYSTELECMFFASISVYCANIWHVLWNESILAATSIHTTTCSTGQTMHTNTCKYFQVNSSKHSNMHTVGNTGQFTQCR